MSAVTRTWPELWWSLRAQWMLVQRISKQKVLATDKVTFVLSLSEYGAVRWAARCLRAPAACAEARSPEDAVRPGVRRGSRVRGWPGLPVPWD